MSERFSRTALILGEAGMQKLKNARIAIFGVGGVGGYALEALIRSGVENIDLYDMDTVSKSNINRQIIATEKTVGRLKVDAARERALEINPSANVATFPIFYSEECEKLVDLSKYDYIIDAIDTVKSKLLLIEKAHGVGVRLSHDNKILADFEKRSREILEEGFVEEEYKRLISEIEPMVRAHLGYFAEALGEPGTVRGAASRNIINCDPHREAIVAYLTERHGLK